MDVTIIGKLYIDNPDMVEDWLKNKEETQIFYDGNWSESANLWEKSEKIGFYNLQKKIPLLSNAIHEMAHSYTYEHLIDEAKYLIAFNLSFRLIYADEKFCLFAGAKNNYILPSRFCRVEKYTDYSGLTVGELRSIASNDSNNKFALVDNANISLDNINSQIENKKQQIEIQKAEIENLKRKQEQEIEKFKAMLEAKYRNQSLLLNKKIAELNDIKEGLEKQLFMLESEIYGIRCYMGEVVDFRAIKKGKAASVDEPLVVYQKIRYLDEELGKALSVYNFGDFDDDFKYFEQILANREDLQDLFLPSNKSFTILRISKTGKSYSASDKLANMLDAYFKYHGTQLAILLRNGQNIYIGWTDENKISIHDGNVFFAPKEETITQETEYVSSSSVEERLSRYFLFSLLQGLCDSSKLLEFPEKIEITKPSKYIVFSMAEGWLQDNTYGNFNDILRRTSGDVKKGDFVLTTQKITRDDIHSGRWGNRSTVYDAYNNDRGRGEKNRTHDVSISDCTVYPINCIDVDVTYAVYTRQFPFIAKEIKTPIKSMENSWSISYDYIALQGPPMLKKETITITNGLFGKDKIIGTYADNMDDFFKWRENRYNDKINVCTHGFEHNETLMAYRSEYYCYEEVERESHLFISEEKERNWLSEKAARANMEIFEGEFLNLTYMNSVFLRYAITNNKLNHWVGDFAYALRYANTALEYLDKREEAEAKMLSEYMDLYDAWQVDVSDWRKEHGYHSLTPTRAKAFAKYKLTKG